MLGAPDHEEFFLTTYLHVGNFGWNFIFIEEVSDESASYDI